MQNDPEFLKDAVMQTKVKEEYVDDFDKAHALFGQMSSSPQARQFVMLKEQEAQMWFRGIDKMMPLGKTDFSKARLLCRAHPEMLRKITDMMYNWMCYVMGTQPKEGAGYELILSFNNSPETTHQDFWNSLVTTLRMTTKMNMR